jgi:hypothetical protein
MQTAACLQDLHGQSQSKCMRLLLHWSANLKSKGNLRLASATWVLSANGLVLAHTVKYYNQEATRFGLFALHQASILCKQTEPTNTRHQCESNSRVQVFG